VSLGYFAGSHIGTIYHYITQYSTYVLIALAVLLAGYIAWRVLRRRRRATQAGQPSDKPSASEAISTEPAAGQPAKARQPPLDPLRSHGDRLQVRSDAARPAPQAAVTG
jgi:hypothetical protein